MALTAANVQVAITGGVYKAPTGTTAPTDSRRRPLTPHSSNSATSRKTGLPRRGTTRSTTSSHGRTPPTSGRRSRPSRSCRIEFTLIESNGYVLEAYHRGSTMTEPTSGNFQLDVKPTVADPSSLGRSKSSTAPNIHARVHRPGRDRRAGRGHLPQRRARSATRCTLRAYPDSNGQHLPEVLQQHRLDGQLRSHMPEPRAMTRRGIRCTPSENAGRRSPIPPVTRSSAWTAKTYELPHPLMLERRPTGAS